MKKELFALTFALAATSVMAEEPLDAKASSPLATGYMQGFPPPKEKILSAADGSFFVFPALRYSVNHMREFFPTRDVPSAKVGEKHYTFKIKLDKKIDDLTFMPWKSDKPMTWKESLEKNYTDGIIVLHKGKIVYENYPAGLTQDGTHAAMSVSKSFAGTIGTILVAKGIIDDSKLATDYVPELKGSGFEGATVRQIMDMTTAIQYSEDYADPKAEVWMFSAAGNPFRPANYKGPANYYEYLKTIKKLEGQNHGDAFGYKTVNTEVLGWIISRATGKGLAQLVSELIWQPMGAHHNAYYNVDPAGIAFAGGGFCLNLRDMAAFGEMIRNEGKFNGKQVIPAKAAKDLFAGGSQKAFEKSGHPDLKGWSYHNMWWITNNDHKAFTARGVHGQTIYIDPKAQMVIARFGSHPKAANSYNDATSLPAYEALAEYLMKK